MYPQLPELIRIFITTSERTFRIAIPQRVAHRMAHLSLAHLHLQAVFLDYSLSTLVYLAESHLLAVQRGHSIENDTCFSSLMVELEPLLQLGNESAYVFAILQLLILPSDIAYGRT